METPVITHPDDFEACDAEREAMENDAVEMWNDEDERTDPVSEMWPQEHSEARHFW